MTTDKSYQKNYWIEILISLKPLKNKWGTLALL